MLPFLDYMGVSRLHAIVLSHQDIDHINGVPEVVDRRRVGCVYANDAFLAQSQTAETAALLLQHLEARGVRVDRAAGIIASGPARIRTLWPAGDPNALREISDNDKSLVSEIGFAGATILLCSDIEQFAQQQVVRLQPGLKTDVVVAPHHGSMTTLDRRFLPQLEAAVLLCSCGKRDFEQGRVAGRDSREDACYTARDGAVTICIDADGVVKRQPTR